VFVGMLLQSACAIGAQPQEIDAPVRALPMSTTLGFESLRLPGSERIGLMGASLVFEVAPDWGVGPAVYAAATGRRGGFFVGGFEGQKRWGLGSDLVLVTGLFVGGGGGGDAPVGGGLMLRPAVSLLGRFGNFDAGLSISDVRFPSGQIHSPQIGVLFAWGGDYRHYGDESAGSVLAYAPTTGFGISDFSATFGEYRLKDGSGRHPGLIGARAEWRDMSRDWHWGIETAAADRGDAAGYMELLGSLGWEHAFLPALPNLKAGVRGAIGLGGGGGLPSGGGLIGKAVATLSWKFAPGWQAGLEAGRIEGLHRQPKAQSLQGWIGMAFDAPPGRSSFSNIEVERNEWVASLRHVLRAERRDGGHGPIDTLGGSFNHALAGPAYLSLQAHSAFAGGAGAYSIGLIGAGLATPAGTASGRWRAGVEALVGASGGGGVNTRGGGLLSGLAWVGWSAGKASQIRLGVGTLRSLHGGLDSPLIELSWSHSFGLTAR
jgi:hypothetical protein